MRVSHLVYEFGKSSKIVRGTIDSITEGRFISLHEGVEPVHREYHTALFKIKVNKIIKGSAAQEHVYFEYLVGGIPASYFDERKYQKEILFMLIETTYKGPHLSIKNSREGLMAEVDTLYELTDDSALFLEGKVGDKTAVVTPLEQVGENPTEMMGESLDQLENTIVEQYLRNL